MPFTNKLTYTFCPYVGIIRIRCMERFKVEGLRFKVAILFTFYIMPFAFHWVCSQPVFVFVQMARIRFTQTRHP